MTRPTSCVSGLTKFASVIKLISIIALLSLSGVLFSGCVSKSKAQAQARLAYIAGQRDGMMQFQQQQSQGGSVMFIGPVNNPIVPWTKDLTLSRAIVSAVYNSPADPQTIMIRRGTEEIPVDPASLLNGDDFHLKPGDVIQLQPRAQ